MVFCLFACDKKSQVNNTNAKEKIVGEWLYVNDDRKLSMQFNPDRSVVMIWVDETVNGSRNIKESGKNERILYEIVEDTDPMTLDLVFYTDSNDSIVKKMKGIFRFLSDTKIQYYGSFDKEIPNDFSKVQSVVLERRE